MRKTVEEARLLRREILIALLAALFASAIPVLLARASGILDAADDVADLKRTTAEAVAQLKTLNESTKLIVYLRCMDSRPEVAEELYARLGCRTTPLAARHDSKPQE